MNIEGKSKVYNIIGDDEYICENDSQILIENGVLLSGTLDKKFVNT